ncbi:MAG: hypothetical protein QOG62_521 [Thermoleophilaceae bacterium]|jgi:4-hydroxybenzoate polyprenyltransferase|nr:hypothetical protein [Thermoleophilaceae bacterium]
MEALLPVIACPLDGLAGAGFTLVDMVFIIAVILAAVYCVVRKHYTVLVVLVVVALVGGALLLGR